jgi:hypothetical protein
MYDSCISHENIKLNSLQCKNEEYYLETLSCGAMLAQNAVNPPHVMATLTHERTRKIKLKRIAGGIIRQG